MIIDAHCHLQSEKYDNDRAVVLSRCREKDLTVIVVAGTLDESRGAVTLAEQNDNCFAVVGLHPLDAKDEQWDDTLLTQLVHNPRVVGIGETGLDYSRLDGLSEPEKQNEKATQKALLGLHIAFARQHDKPVVIHCRDAYEDVLTIVQSNQNVRFMIHTFLGDAETAKRFLDSGCFLSFSGIVTFQKAGAVLDAVEIVPFDRMMIETDAPFLAPVPFRGKRNEPAYVVETAKKIAELKNVQLDDVLSKTAETAKRFFSLP